MLSVKDSGLDLKELGKHRRFEVEYGRIAFSEGKSFKCNRMQGWVEAASWERFPGLPVPAEGMSIPEIHPTPSRPALVLAGEVSSYRKQHISLPTKLRSASQALKKRAGEDCCSDS